MMAKQKRNVGREILTSLREIKRGETGRVMNVPKISSTREKTGLSQARFASILGVSVRTLQVWEQGRRAPSGAARTLLIMVDRDPAALLSIGSRPRASLNLNAGTSLGTSRRVASSGEP